MSKTVAAAAASTSTSAPASAPVRVCVVTGLSGAGKSTALKVFEDMGHFVVDGLPASLAPEMAAMMSRPSMSHFQGIALGMDLRQSTFLDDLNASLEAPGRAEHSPHLAVSGGLDAGAYAPGTPPPGGPTPWSGRAWAWRRPSRRSATSCVLCGSWPIWWWILRGFPSMTCAEPFRSAGAAAGQTAGHPGQCHFLRLQVRRTA